MSRVILYTGKGGVGKTSVAAATALRSAELGYKTIVLSTDLAHSLSDSFDIELRNEPRQIAPNLWGQETELAQTIEEHWKTIRGYISALLAWRGMDEVTADEIAFFPGMEELANLLYIVHYHEDKVYDVVIIDSAPTGETLRLLSFPDIMHWWMTKMFPIGRKVAGAIYPLAKTFTSMPLPDKDVFDSVQELFSELERIRALLSNPDYSSVRLVVNPEKMVIKEAQRTFTYLNLYGYPVDLVVCNRIIPDKVQDIYFKLWKETQKKHHQLIEEAFSPLPILDAPLMRQEIVGIPMLKELGEALYGNGDPTRVYFRGEAQNIQKEDDHYILTFPLPFSGKEDISLSQTGDELLIQVAAFRRNIILPHILVGLPVMEAKMGDGKLIIRFGQRDEASGKQTKRKKTTKEGRKHG